MRTSIYFLLALVSLHATSQSLRQQLLKQDTTLTDVEIIKCKTDTTFFIALLITEQDWWESISVIKFQKGQILWTAKFDTLPSSQSILSARQISLKGIPNPLIEVFDKTHMGNGFYYLYEFKGKTLKRLVSTIAVDYHYDGGTEMKDTNKLYNRIFNGGRLKPTYLDINKDGYADIKLTGMIQIVDDGGKCIKKYYAQKVFLYDKTKDRFIQDSKLRKGFKPGDE